MIANLGSTDVDSNKLCPVEELNPGEFIGKLWKYQETYTSCYPKIMIGRHHYVLRFIGFLGVL